MECNLLTGGITKTCDNNIGGIRRGWLGDRSLIDSVTHGSPSPKISVITMDGNFYPFEFLKKSGSNFTEVETTSDTGSTVVTQTMTLIFTRREQAKIDKLRLLGKGKELAALVEDSNGLYWLLGEYEGLIMTENNSTTGAAKADLNGYTITLVAEEPTQACEVTESAVLAVVSV